MVELAVVLSTDGLYAEELPETEKLALSLVLTEKPVPVTARSRVSVAELLLLIVKVVVDSWLELAGVVPLPPAGSLVFAVIWTEKFPTVVGPTERKPVPEPVTVVGTPVSVADQLRGMLANAEGVARPRPVRTTSVARTRLAATGIRENKSNFMCKSPWGKDGLLNEIRLRSEHAIEPSFVGGVLLSLLQSFLVS